MVTSNYYLVIQEPTKKCRAANNIAIVQVRATSKAQALRLVGLPFPLEHGFVKPRAVLAVDRQLVLA